MDYALLSQRDAARLLNVSPRTLESWRRRGVGPLYVVYSSRCVRYSGRDLHEWLEERVTRKTSHIRRQGSRE